VNFLIVLVLDGPLSAGRIFLDATGHDFERPLDSGRCSFKASSWRTVIQVSTSSSVVRSQASLWVMAPNLAVRLRREEREEVRCRSRLP